MNYLLEVRNLFKHFFVRPSNSIQEDQISLSDRKNWLNKIISSGGKKSHTKGLLRAVDGISFNIKKGETVALVGESGSGKSTVARCLLRLIEPTSGKIFFKGNDITIINNQQFRMTRSQIQMVFQDPDASLNPYLSVGTILSEPLRNFKICQKNEIRERVNEILSTVELHPSFCGRYPHQLSGGQKQRVAIARALISEPQMIILDEPTSSLDLTVQAEIIHLLLGLQEQNDVAFLFISHDLNLVRSISHRVYVMYNGAIIESGTTDDLFQNPMHPYTQALLSAVFNPDPRETTERIILNESYKNDIENDGCCRFLPRCPFSEKENWASMFEPPLLEVSSGHHVACYLYDKISK